MSHVTNLRLLTLAVVATCLLSGIVSAREISRKYNPLSSDKTLDITSSDINPTKDDNGNDVLIYYDPTEPKKPVFKTQSQNSSNNIPSSSLIDAGREVEGQPGVVRGVMSAGASNVEPKGSADVERIKDIAMNSREVRLVGPNQKPTEMKDDVATKFVVAMENLQKEATDVWGQVNEKLDKGWTELKRSEVWGQVNEKLDKGWTDLKTMVEGVVTPNKQQAGRKEN